MRSPHQDSSALAPQDSLANRYGRPQRGDRRQRRRWGRWIAALALVAAVAVTAWFTFSATSRQLAWKDVGYAIESPTRAQVTFQLTKEPEDTVACAVQILDEQYAIVGYRTVEVGPATPGQIQSASDETQYYDADLRTDALGVSGGVQECWIVEDTGSTGA